jgi:hypothetical protein
LGKEHVSDAAANEPSFDPSAIGVRPSLSRAAKIPFSVMRSREQDPSIRLWA